MYFNFLLFIFFLIFLRNLCIPVRNDGKYVISILKNIIRIMHLFQKSICIYREPTQMCAA